MDFRRVGTGIFVFSGMLALILDSKTALLGASTGLELCLKTVIPTLFPFFFFSNLLTAGFLGRKTGMLRPLAQLYTIPPGGESLLVSAFLGGYPAGAQAIASACEDGQLSRREGVRLLSFCNNPGPAFLFGMAAPLFPDRKAPWILWYILLLSSLTAAWMVPGDPTPVRIKEAPAGGVSEAMTRSLRAMAAVCGWVLLFRILLSFLERWILWILPEPVQVLLCGLLELSNGCLSLPRIPDPDHRFVLCAIILSFGGLCVTMQTASVSGSLFSFLYCIMKGFQALLSGTLAWLWTRDPCFLLIYLMVLAGLRCAFRQKTVAFPGSVMYNALRKKRRNDHAVP